MTELHDFNGIQISQNSHDVLTGLPLEGDEAIDIVAHIGGKGSAKTTDLVLLCLQWCHAYAERARCLILRRQSVDLEGVVTTFLFFLTKLFGPTQARNMYNAGENFFRLPTGAYIQCGGLREATDPIKWQGRSWNFLGADEYGEIDPSLFRQVRKELRAPPPMRPRIVLTSNPGATYHSSMVRDWCSHEPWEPFIEPDTGLRAIWIPSNASMNPFIDVDQYEKQIAAVRRDDPELAEALRTGDPHIITGGDFFGGVWSTKRIVLDPLLNLDSIPGTFFLCGDHGGGSSPTWFGYFVMVEDPFYLQGRKVARGSLILFDEVHDAVDGAPNDTIRGSSIQKNCEVIVERCERRCVKPHGYADPQIFQDHGDTKLEEVYRQYGVKLRGWNQKTISGKKGQFRIEGASLTREFMHNAGSEQYPGIYICRNCEYALATIPFLQTDKRRRDDVDSSGPDHAYDAVKEAVRFVKRKWTTTGLHR